MNKEPIGEEFQVIPLTPDLVKKYASDICEALDQILGVDPHTQEQLLQEESKGRVLYRKWDHSFILLKGEIFVGIIVSYERKAEDNDQYPHNSIYVSDLAVSKKYQRKGLGKFLIKTWLDKNRSVGFLELDGQLRFSVQTNSADWNKHVQKLYDSFGFKKIAEKVYDNRVDSVHLLEG